MKLLTLLVVIKLTYGAFIIDESAREFRKDFLKFKAISSHAVDRAFFEVYNSLNIQLMRSFEPIQDFQEMWNDLCDKTLKLDLVKKTNRRWFSACNNVNKLISESRQDRKRNIDEFYSPGIFEPTPTALILDEIFTKIELLHLDKMWNIYIKNSSCVSSLLGNYFPSFEPIVDNVIFIVNLTKAEIPNFFNSSSNVEAFECIRWTEECTIRSNASKCLERSVSYFEFLKNTFKNVFVSVEKMHKL